MSNKNNNLIVSVLGILSIFVLGFVMIIPLQTNAYITSGGYVYVDGGNNLYDYNTEYNSNSTKTNPVPTLYSISPDSAITNGDPVNIMITGSGFTPLSVARFNGSDRPTTYISPTKLKMELSPKDMKGNGKYLINVFNPIPDGGLSNTNFFTLKTGTVGGYTIGKNNTQNTGATTKASTSNTTLGATANTTNLNSSTTDSSRNNLSANVSSAGKFRFLPDTIIKWIFFIVLIFLAVVLWRKIYVTDKERNVPLKHA